MESDKNKQTGNSEGWIGIFYFNRKDSRIVVPKRFSGLGFTLNMANPYTYILLIVIVSAITLFRHFIK